MNGLQWWCSAQTAAWTWSPRPFPGVWLLVALLAGLYWLMRKSAAEADAASVGSRKKQWAWCGGVLALWLALDWPVGALSGYLASAHMLQYLLTALVAPPLLLLGVPDGAWRRLAARTGVVRALRFLTHPLIAMAIFQVILYYTHLPSVVDRLMVTPLGSFAIDAMWLTGGLIFWWPVVAPVPARPRFGYPLKMGYLFLSTVLNTMPYAFLTFGELAVLRDLRAGAARRAAQRAGGPAGGGASDEGRRRRDPVDRDHDPVLRVVPPGGRGGRTGPRRLIRQFVSGAGPQAGVAVKPTRSMASTRASRLTFSPVTVADPGSSVTSTEATPATAPSALSTRPLQCSQLIPTIFSSIVSMFHSCP